MNADDAFGNLMRENKLLVPESDAPELLRSRPAANASAPVPDSVSVAPAAVKAAAGGIPEVVAEYVPPHETEEVNAISSHPTETDLEAVDVPVDMPGEYDDPLVDKEAEIQSMMREAFGEGKHSAPVVPDASGASLAGARRVKRFAQLPLAGASAFDSAAMELSVGLAAFEPERPSLLITSAERGEGRTEVAIRFALALARRVGSRVLLADFDLKNPQVAVRLGLNLKYFAIADVLNGTCRLDEALVVSEEDNLYVLSARPSDRLGDELINSKRATALLAGIHSAFDFTVIDSGPIGGSDSQILCRLAGAAAVVGYRNLTVAGDMEKTAAAAETAGVRVAGMILSGM